MKRPSRLNRRRFIAATAAAAAGAATGCRSSRSSPWRFFTIEEARTLNAVCEQIIPADDAPGAAWAGVIRYIDRQLVGRFKEHQKTYREGIAGLNRLAGGRFEELDAARQIEILKKVEKDKQLRPFFDLAIAHTMQGFYGSPRHGGNRDWISWQMLGIPISPSRGREHYDLTQGAKA
jgi:gluconate 2-dehydrogenase gamma chain